MTASPKTRSSPKPVTAKTLEASAIRHAFFTREGGVSKGIYAGLNAGIGSEDDPAAVGENRARMAAWLGVDQSNLVSPYQVHSADAVVVTSPWGDDRPRVDGLVTATPGLALGIVTADCGPVLFADKKAGVIGACHAGWKGALTGVLENTVDAMLAAGATRAGVTAVLGPSISQANYEVGPDFPKPFLDRDESSTRYFKPSRRDGHHMFDLSGYIVDRLRTKCGIEASALNICTYADEDDYFSYRRTTHRNEPDYGRQLSAIVLN